MTANAQVVKVELTRTQAVMFMVLTALLWSSAGVVTRHLEQVRSFEVTFWRSAFTVLSLLVLLPLLQGRQVLTSMRNAPTSFWLSGVCWGIMFTSFMLALTLTTVANVLITMAIGPLLTALLARWVIHQPLPKQTWWAIGVAGMGITLMYATQLQEINVLGTFLALCVPGAAAVNWVIAQRAAIHRQNINLAPAVMVGAALSALFTLPWAWPFQASTHDVAWLAFLGLTQLALPCVMRIWCASVLKAAEVALLALLEIIFGIALVWLGANEVPPVSALFGGSLVLGALLLNEGLAWSRQRPS